MSWSNKLGVVSLHTPHDLDLIKSRLKIQDPTHAIKTVLEDPYNLNQSLGFKERRYSLDFNTLKQIPAKLGIIAAIIQTRCNQVSAFAFPFRTTKSLGYQIKHKNPSKLTTKGEREFILDLENYIQNCGYRRLNSEDSYPRDNFKTFLSKLVRDSLTYDGCAAELVPDREGKPYEFLAVDASTIRLATANFNSEAATMWSGYDGLQNKNFDDVKSPAYVQLVDGRIENVYAPYEMMYGIRNPRSDVLIGGYGYSELEMLINIITSHLNAETHNSKYFSQGSAAKGMINFKGDSMGPDQLEGFRRLWRDQVESSSNAWRTPIFQSEGGVEWIDLQKANRDMEFSQWLEYLIKVSCSVFNIDPAEVGFEMSGGVSSTPLFESSQEWKLKASRDKGLRPILTFFEDLINRNIINRLDDDFVFQFVGLDELTEEQKTEQRIKQLGAWLTINEVRRAEDLPDIEGGDIVLNPTYLQGIQLKQQAKQEEQQALMQQNQPQAPGQEGMGQQNTQQPQEEDSNSHIPQYNT